MNKQVRYFHAKKLEFIIIIKSMYSLKWFSNVKAAEKVEFSQYFPIGCYLYLGPGLLYIIQRKFALMNISVRMGSIFLFLYGYVTTFWLWILGFWCWMRLMLYVMVDTFGAAMLCILTAFRLLVNCYWSALHHTCMLGYVISGYYFFFFA